MRTDSNVYQRGNWGTHTFSCFSRTLRRVVARCSYRQRGGVRLHRIRFKTSASFAGKYPN
ncbi:hypothetical protein AMATHDRAFT_61912 [Amanita thiersii Skay4041]|uniref:Uncharacterized protein n=1 Tax=Amanita thiersii Skay4041 TaxID=703135 RepID=A0A2A9NGF2_9AGAR|nr:hypothetical protein AMATHDRAFT_61912 [Amanita thiersii Skay4041]